MVTDPTTEVRIDEGTGERIEETTKESICLDPASVKEHFDRIGHFRILVVGRSNAGKTIGEFKASFREWFWSRFWAMVFDFVASKTGQWFPRRFSTWFSQPRSRTFNVKARIHKIFETCGK